MTELSIVSAVSKYQNQTIKRLNDSTNKQKP